MSICTVAFVGFGDHGRHMVELFARAGTDVRVIPWQSADADMGRVSRWSIDDSAPIEVYGHLEAAWECDLVVVSVPGEPELQRQALAAVEARISGGTAIAIDTSDAPVEHYLDVLERPEQAVGVRFPRPLDGWDVVAVTPGEATAPGVHQAVLQICQQLGKHAYLPVADAAE